VVEEEDKNVFGAKNELGASTEGFDGPRNENEEKLDNLLDELELLELEPEVEAEWENIDLGVEATEGRLGETCGGTGKENKNGLFSGLCW
jgi:hypothetical protein